MPHAQLRLSGTCLKTHIDSVEDARKKLLTRNGETHAKDACIYMSIYIYIFIYLFIYFYDVSLYSCIYVAESPMPGILRWRAISAAVGGSLLLDGFELRASGKALKASNMGRSKGEQNIVWLKLQHATAHVTKCIQMVIFSRCGTNIDRAESANYYMNWVAWPGK